MIGSKLLHYNIVSELGRGGMGVVYKAQDTRLDRTVAIKVLPHQVAAQAAERERFQVEAKASAALNHPNVAQVYAIEETEQDLFIVMEFVEGRELKAVLDEAEGTGLELDLVQEYAVQIAAGLEAAHERGIIHRDIKPANIMVTPKNQIKIMDFGLAKMSDAALLTRAGMTLGTTAYMSPEQATAQPVDHRSDLWSFGIILYEMIAGVRPFPGEYEQAVLYGVINESPPALTEFRGNLPHLLLAVVGKALEKKPEARYQNAESLREDLQASFKSDPASDAKTVAMRPPEVEPPVAAEAPEPPEVQTPPALAESTGSKKPLILGLAAVAVVVFAGMIYFLGDVPAPGGVSPEVQEESAVPGPPERIAYLAQIAETREFLESLNEQTRSLRVSAGSRADFESVDSMYVVLFDSVLVRGAYFFQGGKYHDLHSEAVLESLREKHRGERSVWIRDIGD